MTTSATTTAPQTITAAQLRAGDDVLRNGFDTVAYSVLARGELIARSYCGQPYTEVPIIAAHGPSIRMLIPGDQVLRVIR